MPSTCALNAPMGRRVCCLGLKAGEPAKTQKFVFSFTCLLSTTVRHLIMHKSQEQTSEWLMLSFSNCKQPCSSCRP